MRVVLWRPTVTSLLAVSVLVLLPVLAALQNHWLTQVSEHERERLRRSLVNGMESVARDLNAELTRTVARLELHRFTIARPRSLSVGTSFEAPVLSDASGLVAEGFYAVQSEDSSLQTGRCDVRQRTCAPAAWPAELATIETDLERYLRRGRGDVEDLSRILRGPTDRRPVVVVPFEAGDGHTHERRERGRDARVTGAVLLVLNTNVLRNQVLPALVRRHFGPPHQSDFRVAIVDRERPLHVIYHDAALPLDTLVGSPEGWQELLTLRADEFADDDSQGDGGHVSGGRPVRVFGRNGRDDDEEWMLLARHRQGSLQAAVDILRRRNLFISTGILALMGVAVGLIAVTSRRAQRLAQQQVEFVAGVSHELRTPVAAIHLAAQNLADGTVADPSRIRRYGATIQAESQRLRETVERVLQFASYSGRHSAGSQSPVAIGGIIDDVVASARREHPSVAISTDAPADLPPVPGDAAALRACLQNLVTNAVKYAGPSCRIRISTSLGSGRRGPELRLSVEDNGPGIESSDLRQLFEPFYRGRMALEHRIQGNGLGLHIVARIAQMHGGRVAARSRVGRGATFTVYLPVHAVRQEPATAPAQASAERHGHQESAG